MASRTSKLRQIPRETISASSALLSLVRRAALEPALTGPLLLALTQSPPKVRAKLLEYVPALADDRKLALVLRTLKVLLGFGLASRVNSVLNVWARNHWQVRRIGTPWDWSGEKEVVVITGGCSGFGLEMVKGFSGRCRVVVLDVQDLPKELEHRENVSYYRCDVTNYAAIHETANAVRSDVGNPSVLINNAGIANFATIIEADEERIEKLFKVNLISHFVLIKEFLPAMLEQKKGHIVSIASMASYVSGSPLVDYCASKGGVLALWEGLNTELRRHYGPNGKCIQNTIVHPTWHATAIIAPAEPHLREKGTYIGPPRAVADKVIKQVLSGRGDQIFVPDGERLGSLTRAYPTWMQDVILAIHKL